MSIAVELYRTTSPNKQVDKELSNKIEFSCTMLDDESVVSPTIRISTSADLIPYNYVKIPAFNRYYYVNTSVVRNGLWELKLSVDVLKTYASEIRELNAVIGRNSNIYNSYFHDNEISVYSNKIVQAKKFSNPNVFNANTFLLTTV